uniref:PID domain-containing protein n=1 Tax=Amphimedon queenslandica TaxID=400682 RepID=A0A1X7UC28_AMPQE
MPRNRGGGGGGEAGGGDWSDTGTFVRKPATGWLHKDTDLADGSYIRYKLTYFGCVKITESMRSLQYQVRTLATREAIIILAEHNERIASKKRKVPRQISRLLGDICTDGCKEVNLCIDVEELLIKSATTGMEISNHSLTAISFASGGED